MSALTIIRSGAVRVGDCLVASEPFEGQDPGVTIASARDGVPCLAVARTCGTPGCVHPAHLSAATHPWELSNRADPQARDIADNHYNRQKIGAQQFAPPGRTIVLLRRGGWTATSKNAFWISAWPFAEHVKHAWAGALVCTAFRNEGTGDLSSDLVRGAIAATRAIWGEPPPLGMVTFIDRSKVRGKKHFGRCYREAGFEEVGRTAGDLTALLLSPENFPPADPALKPRAGIKSKYASVCRPR